MLKPATWRRPRNSLPSWPNSALAAAKNAKTCRRQSVPNRQAIEDQSGRSLARFFLLAGSKWELRNGQRSGNKKSGQCCLARKPVVARLDLRPRGFVFGPEL